MVWIFSEQIKCPQCFWSGESWGLKFIKNHNGRILNKCPECGNLIPEIIENNTQNNIDVVIEGTWIYSGQITCHIRIIKSDILYGSGDYEDPPEYCNDKEVECYYIEFESMIEKGNYNSRHMGFLSLSQAII